jgi:hypothetical protein
MKKNLNDWGSMLLGAVVVCSVFCVSMVAYATYCGEGQHSSLCDAFS